MYGDPAAIRRLARSMREQAEDIRSEAAALRARAEAVSWQGCAADAMRSVSGLRTGELGAAAQAHEEAASALERHATEVEWRQELIADLERRARALCAAAEGRLADLGHRIAAGATGLVPDPVDELLARFDPPPSGHLAWLDVRLPGLHLGP